MKKNIKHVSKRMLAIILTTMIIMSTMLVGSFSVNAASNGKFDAGETIYFDFRNAVNNPTNSGSKNGANIYLNSGSDYVRSCSPSWDNINNRYISNVQDYVAVTLSKAIDFSTYSGSLFKAGGYNWTEVYANTSKVPTGSQNMIIVKNGDYEWGTYSDGSGGDVGTVTVYFQNTANWSNVYVHYWGGTGATSWAGKEMTKVTGTDDIYTYTFPADNGKCIFNNGNNNGKQTDDLTVKDGYLYVWNNSGDSSSNGKNENKDANWSATPYDDGSDTTPHSVTIKSNIKVTATVDGVDTVISENGDSETQSSKTVEASVLTLEASPVDYNFAGWKIDGDAKITSGSESKKTITVKVNGDTTITATAITLTPRLSVNSTVAKNTTATVEPNEQFTLNALSKVGDKTQKATKYTVDFYQYTSDINNATHIGSQITINNVDYTNINNLGRDPEDGEYLIGNDYTASMTYSISSPGTYYFYADIRGYDSNGNLTTGEAAVKSLGTSFTKDEVVVTVAEPFNKATAYSSGLWVDVQPSLEDSSIALLKWTNKSGSSGTTNDYTLYVPGGIDLTKMPIYYAFNTLKINGTTIEQGGTYNFVSGNTYNVTGNSTNYTLNVYQSTSDSMFTTTNADLPTKSYGSEISKVEYTGQFISITASNGKLCDNLGIDKIKGRGNSSWEASGIYYGKYAYNIKFDSKVKPLKMNNATKAKSWCLLANNMDESLLRNITTYQTAMLAGLNNVPEYKVADLYNNGEYLGSYLITEKVDVGSSKLVDGETAEDHYDGTGDGKTHSGSLSYNGSTIEYQYVDTGNLKDGYTAENLSYLIEFDLQTRAQAENCWFKTPQGQYIAFKAPEDINKTEMEFVIKKWVDAETAVYNGNYTKMNELLDLDSFADVYLVQEFTKNLDSGATSYFVYWNGVGAESADDVKWEATPIWDYDWALGGYRYLKDVVSGADSSGDPSATSGWLAKYKKIVQRDDAILNTMNFQATLANNSTFWNTNVVNAWNSDFYDSINAVFSDNGYIKEAYDANSASFNMNEKRYKFIADDLTYSWGSVNTGSTPEACYNYLLNWGKNRATWMNSKLGETVSVSLSSNNTNVKTGNSVTLTANLTRSKSSYPITYKYYVSTDGSKYTLLTETTDTSVTTDAFISAGTYKYYVEATYSTYTKATSGTVTVTVTGEELTGVSLSVSSASITVGNSVTLTATPTPANLTDCTYTFYRSNDDVVSDDDTVIPSTSNKTTDKPSSVGTYYYYVKAESNGVTVTSSLVKVEVKESQGTHTVKVWFKSSSAYMYVPSVRLDTGSYTEMTKDEYIGSTFSGSLKFYWFYADIEIDSNTTHTLTFKTKSTSATAKSDSGNFSNEEYYFAMDNIVSGSELVDLTDAEDYIKNYHRSATHMVYSDVVPGDYSLGYTFINGREYAMGEIVNEETAKEQSDLSTQVLTSRLTKAYAVSASSVGASYAPFTIDSATLAQKCAADITNVSDLQMALLDVNLDGKVDILDATIMQKVLAQ